LGGFGGFGGGHGGHGGPLGFGGPGKKGRGAIIVQPSEQNTHTDGREGRTDCVVA
jgi:hypothetical protein